MNKRGRFLKKGNVVTRHNFCISKVFNQFSYGILLNPFVITRIIYRYQETVCMRIPMYKRSY